MRSGQPAGAALAGALVAARRPGDRRRRRRRRHRRRRRAPDRLLRAGRRASSAARWASATPTRSCACCEHGRAGRGRPVVGFVESGGARMQEGTAALAGYGRIFRHTVALTGVVPQISVVSGASAGGGAYSPALTDLIVMTAGRGDVPDRPRRRARGAGRGDRRRRPRRPARPRAQRRLPSRRARRGQRRRPRARAARLPALGRRRSRRPARRRSTPSTPIPGAFVPAALAQRLRRPRRAGRRSSTATRCRSCARAGRATWSPRWPGSTGGRWAIVANQPRYLGGVLDAEGSEKAARFVSFCNSFGLPLIAIVDTPGLHARLPAGAGRRDPLRRLAGAGLRRRARCPSSPSCCASPTAAPTSR